MKPTNDRLAVARAVHEQTMMRVVCHRHGINASVVHSSKIDLEAIIAAIPEPEPQIKYGCHCDIENTVSGEPDDCVFDNGDVDDCVYAVELQREGKGKLACRYWKPIAPAEPPDDSPATLPAPTGPGLWWMFDPRESERGWRGQNVFTETCFGQPRLVIRSPGFEDKPRDGQLWVGPLVAPTAKGEK